MWANQIPSLTVKGAGTSARFPVSLHLSQPCMWPTKTWPKKWVSLPYLDIPDRVFSSFTRVLPHTASLASLLGVSGVWKQLAEANTPSSVQGLGVHLPLWKVHRWPKHRSGWRVTHILGKPDRHFTLHSALLAAARKPKQPKHSWRAFLLCPCCRQDFLAMTEKCCVYEKWSAALLPQQPDGSWTVDAIVVCWSSSRSTSCVCLLSK